MPSATENETFETLLEKAHQDDVEAQIKLASMYYGGTPPCTKDLTAAKDLYERAAASGHPVARLMLGLMYFAAQGVDQDLPRAKEYLYPLAEQGIPSAQFMLGSVYLSLYESDADNKNTDNLLEWRKWIYKAAEAGEPNAVDTLHTQTRFYFDAEGHLLKDLPHALSQTGKKIYSFSKDFPFQKNTRLLLLGENALHLYSLEDGTVRQCAKFDKNGDVAQVTDHLRKLINEGSMESVVIATSETSISFRSIDTLPSKLSIFDTARFLCRKTQLDLPGHSHYGTFRETAADGSVRYMTAAYTPSQIYTALAQATAATKTSMAFFSVESIDLVAHLATAACHVAEKEKTGKWHVLIAQTETGGAHVTVVRHGNLVLSRTLPAFEADNDFIYSIESTFDYAQRLGYTPEQGMEVVYIGENPGTAPAFKEGVTIHYLPLRDALEQIGVKRETDSPYADELYAGWILHRASLRLALPEINSEKSAAAA